MNKDAQNIHCRTQRYGGYAIRTLTAKGYTNLIGASSKELDLRNQQAVKIYGYRKPEVIIDAAAKVEGSLQQ
jgi:GDP-L-fucose synthase